MKIRKVLSALASISMLAGLGVVATTTVATANAAGQGWDPEGVAWMAPANGGVDVYRVYNPYTGSHHYTQDRVEYENLIHTGWNDEKVAFKADAQGSEVYRLYNRYNGQHHYTLNVQEKDSLVLNGWEPEGVAWHVSTASSVPVYRVYNSATGEHLWTTNAAEYNFLTSVDPLAKATDALAQLTVSDYLAPGYEREEFGKTWVDVDGNNCGTRDDILARDLTNITKKDDCRVATGTLNDPYTGTVIDFVRGTDGGNDGGVQIDHVVALSNAWKSGANGWTRDQRIAYANDPYVLLAVDDQANQDKSDSAADKWLPSNAAYRCDYVARQIGIKSKYKLTVTNTERDAMNLVLATCPAQTVPAGVGAPSVPAPPAPAPKPDPEPSPEPDPDPAPNPEPKPEVQYGIRPGAWCSPEGAIGYSAKGVQYVCRPSDSGKSLHWRRP
ncbi:GmrSD restriction endonuclease domain-containing protein [Bifidobacterium vespertilionis]|uniref:GmrSD restriction endonuclease domain-containing protein n=1 Tax=Bifidobacterium vespertilionis TaxID=2562524 RepID=UPI001C85976C|nr:DUF1524 domain-containing protein [Bifidobacterium vespertilionis]